LPLPTDVVAAAEPHGAASPDVLDNAIAAELLMTMRSVD
jgi:hypothetical protein